MPHSARHPATGSNEAGVSHTVPSSPVNDHTYNVMQALTSKLEAIEAYEVYSDEEEGGELFMRLLEDERHHATLLLEELRRLLAA